MTERTLVILRHAKAANPDGSTDLDRPLTSRGHADAVAVGAWLSRRGYRPDVVLCSPARRTMQTWHVVAPALPGTPRVRYENQMYAASAQELLTLVTGVGDEAATVILIGHNPGVSQLSELLDPDGADPEGLRTAAIVVHAWDGSWAGCVPGVAAVTASHTARA